VQNFQSVLLSNAHLLHNLPDPDAPRIRNQAHESLTDVLDLVVRVQEADVPLHDCLCLCLERWFIGLRSRLRFWREVGLELFQGVGEGGLCDADLGLQSGDLGVEF
jgi:hypothetical protein